MVLGGRLLVGWWWWWWGPFFCWRGKARFSEIVRWVWYGLREVALCVFRLEMKGRKESCGCAR